MEKLKQTANYKIPESYETILEDLKRIIYAIQKDFSDISSRINWLIEHTKTLEASATWNPGSIGDGDEEAVDVTVTGAAMGDMVLASFSLDLSDLILEAAVTAANTVTCVLANNTGAPVNLASGTLNIRVWKL